MSYLPSLAADAVLLDVFKTFPRTALPLIEYHQALMRGDSPLTVAQRELIAAYVSGLNACTYCHGVHAATAEAFGVSDRLLGQLLDDVEAADVEERFKPILAYVAKLTRAPSRMAAADADRVFAAGWNEQALHDAVSVCALFNFMNRLVDGLGIEAGPDYFRFSARRLSEGGYIGLARLLEEGRDGG